jgi:hypothetical protein
MFRFSDPRLRRRLGWALLAIASVLGCLTVYWNQFGDEADNLIIGWLLTRGYVLYRDVFSHHFPFPYYWSAVVIGLFGKSILAARLSVWVFQIAALGTAMKLSRFHLSLGLAGLLWSILRHLYRSNLLLYSPFAGASLLVVFSVTMALVLNGAEEADWKQALAIGLFSVIAVLSDPLSIYAISVALICLIMWRRKQGLLALLFTAIGLSGYAVYLGASGTFQDFMRDAILFNTEVYAEYLKANHLRFGELLDTLWKGLGIMDPAWQDFDPLRAISLQDTQFDRWAFTGFFYRSAIILAVTLFLAQKRFRVAVFLYLFAAATLVISRWEFRAAGFVMISLVVSAALSCQEWRQMAKRKLPTLLQVAVGFLFGLTAIWLSIRVVDYTFVQEPEMLRDSFAPYEISSARLREQTCGHAQDTVLGYYPSGDYQHWFAEMEPVGRYVFLWPWMAEAGLSEIIDALDQDQTLALVYVRHITVWGIYDSREYLGPLCEYLDRHYVEIREGEYMSPGLAAECQE